MDPHEPGDKSFTATVGDFAFPVVTQQLLE